MASIALHNAARDGYLDRLREATRKECNAPDEDGMTPTLWAAHAGKLDSLRLLVGRGGDPNKCDHYGNTALHLAATNGHKEVVIFLMSFGVNLWALDNDNHTAKAVAGIREREDIMMLLDKEMAIQLQMNPKKAKSYKEKAVTDVEKRLKELQKLHKKAEKKAVKDDKKLKQSELTMAEQGGIQATMLHRDSVAVYSSKTFSELTQKSDSKKKKTIGGAVAERILKAKKQSSFNNENGTNGSSPGDFKIRGKEGDGKQTVTSLQGLRRDSEVIFTKKIGDDMGRAKAKDMFDESPEAQKQIIHRAMSQPDLLNDPAMQIIMHQQRASIFDRPGFGNVAFRSGTAMGNSMLSAGEDGDKTSDRSDSIGSAGSLAHRNKTPSRPPWTEDEINMEEVDEYDNASPIEVFLLTHHMRELLRTFVQEEIDLEALMLLTEHDLKELRISLGQRKKLMEAINRRKAALDDSGEVYDSRL